MKPATIRKIVQDIRHQRELLTAKEKWAQTFDSGEMRAEAFREINFWRERLAEAEAALSRS